MHIILHKQRRKYEYDWSLNPIYQEILNADWTVWRGAARVCYTAFYPSFGIALSFYHNIKCCFYGLALACVNIIESTSTGLFIALLCNYVAQWGNPERRTGLFIAPINIFSPSIENVSVISIGLLNHFGSTCKNSFPSGLSIGLFYNYISSWVGVQIGLVNLCGEDSKGVQLGLLNFRKGSMVPVPVIAVRRQIMRGFVQPKKIKNI